MKGSLKFEREWKEKLDMQQINLGTSLERKIRLLNEDWDKLYYIHYNFKASNKSIDLLLDHIKKIRMDLNKYEEILKRYIKYQGAKKWKKIILI